jgi:hypothetical protein
MALTLDVNGTLLAFGLNWASVPAGRGRSGKVADLGVRFKATHKVHLAAQDQHGFLEAGGRLPGRLKKGAALAGAALFASLVPVGQDSILVYVVEAKKKAVVVVVVDGLIYQDIVLSLGSGLDKSDSGIMRSDGQFELSEEATLRKVQEKIDQIYNETGKDFTPYGNFYTTFPHSEQMDLGMLLDGDCDGASLSKFSDPRAALKMGAAALVCASLMFGFQQYKEHERKRKEIEAAQQQVDPMETYRANLTKVLGQAKFTTNDAKRLLLVPLDAREPEIGGWMLRSAKCTSLGACEEKWSAINGTAETFKEANHVPGKILSTADSLDAFVFGHQLEVKSAALNPAALPSATEFSARAVVLAQNMARVGVIVTWGKVPAVDFSLPPGVTAGMVKAGEGVARSSVEITGPSGLAHDVLEAMPDNLMVTEAALSGGEELDSKVFSIKGFYYVKK